jgi:hypothetical protein
MLQPFFAVPLTVVHAHTGPEASAQQFCLIGNSVWSYYAHSEKVISMTSSANEFLLPIAAAIEVEVGALERFTPQFERAACWYRLDCNAPNRTAPSLTIPKLDSIRGNANKLLNNLGVESVAEAEDGPSNSIIDALVLTTDKDSTPMVEATRRLARLTEILDGIAAIKELSERAQEAGQEAARVGELTVERGHTGDRAVNDWIATMMILYKNITGREPATSVGKTGAANEGVATGPLIRFLTAAGEPLEIRFSEEAWRSRVRTILEGAKPKNSK